MSSILITGGTGSFGQAFVKQLLTDSAGIYSRIAILSRGEHAQETMARELNDERLRFFIGDVRDRHRLEMAMRGVDTVIHAAALKVVPIAEYNPTECIATNIGGAENVVQASLRAGVRRVIALSTDKAVNPINLYGASKLCAEKIFIAANALAAGSCNYGVIRYGNVVGSNGSVLPLFKKLAAEGKPLPVTDKRMTRFWLTMQFAVSLVETKMIEGTKAGTILIPKIPSIRIADLAEAISPGNVTYDTGIRPGEKIHETLLTEDEARSAVDLQTHYIVHPNGINGHGALLPQGFRYSSDTNTKWLSATDLKAML